MLKNRTGLSLAVAALLGMAACGGGEEVENADIVEMDTITQQQTEMVEVPVQTTDTALVQTEVSVDTAVSVDTINP